MGRGLRRFAFYLGLRLMFETLVIVKGKVTRCPNAQTLTESQTFLQPEGPGCP